MAELHRGLVLDPQPQVPAPSPLCPCQNRTQEIETFMLTYNVHMAHPFEWKKGVRFYQRMKDKIAARSERQLAA